MSDWQPIETAPRDGTPVLVPYPLDGNDVHGYVPWAHIGVVIAWNDDDGWKMCFMRDGVADSEGVSWQFFMDISEPIQWMPIPKPPEVSPSPTVLAKARRKT